MAPSRKRRRTNRGTRRQKTSSAAPPSSAAPSSRRRAPNTRARIIGFVKRRPKLTTISVLVGIVVGILAIVVWFFPDIKPKPKSPTDAALEITDFRKHVSLGDYLNENNLDPSTYKPGQLAHDGVVATVKAVKVSGVKRADLYWTLRDTASDANVGRGLAGHFKITTTGDSGGRAFWAPAPSPPGRYLVVWTLEKADRTILATAKTDEFAVV